MSKPKNSKDALEFIHTLDSLAIKKQQEEINRLCAWGRGLESDLSHARVEISFLKAEVERLRASSFVTAVPVEEYEKLKAEVERLKQQVQYWKIEAECDHGRWLRCLEDLEKLRNLK
jgi:predicted RNase H-like nuclease (RuvC/YqgF family)